MKAGAALALLFALAGAALPALAVRWARPAVVEIGPNDVAYITGFRPDWERDGKTRFRWTTPHATVTVPLRVSGAGARLRARVRRHLIEPAEVIVSAEGREAGRFEIQADPQVAYRTVDLELPAGLAGGGPLVLTFQSSSVNPRPLGMAVDWIEIERGGARFALTAAHLLALGLIAGSAFAAPLLAGARRRWSVAHALAVVSAATVGTAWDVIASQRIVTEGAGFYVAVALIAAGAARWPRLRSALGIDTAAVAGALALVTLAALAVRLVLVLHPQFYYPDVKVHALFAWQLARHGLGRFLSEFTANQYRFSLGLQMENGHWYAFPYPPAFYVLCWPLIRLARYRPEIAVSALAAVVNSLEAWIVFGVARRFRASSATALASAAALLLLPIFTARLTLAYFPALVGHAVDAAVILVVIAHLADLHRPKVVGLVAALVAVALLTYTQSVLNFAVLVPLVVIAHLALDRAPDVRRRMAGLVIAAGLGGLVALAVFYGRYVPIFIGMQKGVPMAEERILIEKQQQAAAVAVAEEKAPPDDDDPFDGPRFDALRGVRKAAWRMWVFYGGFAFAVVAGIALVIRRQPPSPAAFAAAWAACYLVLNFLSGSLPGPNLVRYNKDLEIVAPLFCIALAFVGEALWLRSRALALLYGGAYVLYGVARAATDLMSKFVLER